MKRQKKRPAKEPDRRRGSSASSAEGKSADSGTSSFLTSSAWTWLLGLSLIAATLVVYWPALRGEYLMDDGLYIQNNLQLRSLHGLGEIWFSPAKTPQYYPLTFTVFWAGYQLWGLNPLGYHLLNVGLHGLAAVLLWQVLARLRVKGAWLAGAIFALHPVCVMSVAWMTELKNTLSVVLVLGAMWAYVRFAGLGIYRKHVANSEQRTANIEHQTSNFELRTANSEHPMDWRFYGLALALFQLALFAKTAVSFVPLTLLLIVWWQRERVRWRDVWPLLPMLAMAVGMGQVTIYVERHWGGGEGAFFEIARLDRVLISGRSFWFYLGKLFFPYPLTFIYERWEINASAWWQYLYPVATVGLLAGLWAFRGRIGKAPFAAMVHFYVCTSLFVMLVMLSMMRFTWVCDHWQYFGCLSVIPLAAAGIIKVLESVGAGRRMLKPVVCGGLLTVLGVLTWRQCLIYTTNEKLWQTTILRNPKCGIAHYNLGNALIDHGDVSGAIFHFQKAVEIRPDYGEAHNNLGTILLHMGQAEKAMAEFKKALKIQPDNPDAHNNLGSIFSENGQLEEAIIEFQKALTTLPDDPDAHNNLGVALAKKGQYNEAIAHFEKALKVRPGSAELQKNLDTALRLKQGQTNP